MQAIPAEAIEELKDALGGDNVSDDAGVKESYSYMNSIGSILFGFWNPEPACVVLPGTVEDVKAVLSICRKYKLSFKAHSTAWINLSLACNSKTVLMDLRRMDRVLEFNKRDGYVVVEPYVPGGLIQADVMKDGQNCHLCGAGPNASLLASATSCQGSGGTSQSMSNSERNCLGIEWITPSGDRLLLGSPGTPDAGWFCGDGPGPSLRGMMRGAMANGSANGVFTKCALKCYPWYPPKQYRCEGSPPYFKTVDIPFFEIRIIEWYNAEDEREGLYAVSEAELSDYCARVGPGAFESAGSITNEEYREIVDSGIFRSSFPRGVWTLSIVGNSRKALDYKLSALESIVERTNGVSVDPKDLGHEAYEVSVQTAIRATSIFKAAFMPTGGMMCHPPMSYETIDQMWGHCEEICLEVKEEAISKEQIEDDYVDNIYCSLDEHGHYGHNEAAYKTDCYEAKSDPNILLFKGMEKGLRHNLQVFYMGLPPTLTGFLEYMSLSAKIQDLVDPDGIAGSMRIGGFKMLRPLSDLKYIE